MQNNYKASYLTIDVTTTSSVFDCMSAAGSWYNHRFGTRSKYAEIPFSSLKVFLDQCYYLSHITLSSVFGDPLLYQDLEKLLEYCVSRRIKTTVITYGMGTDSRFKLLKKCGTNVAIKICGINEECNSVYQGVVWEELTRNISCLSDQAAIDKKNCLEFSIYRHNRHQLSDLKKFSDEKNWNLKIVPGLLNYGNIGSIIDLAGNWLYDVHSKSYNGQSKIKTVEGWHALKHFVRVPECLAVVKKSVSLDQIISASILFIGPTGELYADGDSYYQCSGSNILKNQKNPMSTNTNLYHLV